MEIVFEPLQATHFELLERWLNIPSHILAPLLPFKMLDLEYIQQIQQAEPPL